MNSDEQTVVRDLKFVAAKLNDLIREAAKHGIEVEVLTTTLSFYGTQPLEITTLDLIPRKRL